MQPCVLYTNSKNAKENLFAAASALFLLTGDKQYRIEADQFFDWTYGAYLYNWNNVAQQGVIILAAAVAPPGMNITRSNYQDMLRTTTTNWAGCSLSGTSFYKDNVFCKCVSTLLELESNCLHLAVHPAFSFTLSCPAAAVFARKEFPSFCS